VWAGLHGRKETVPNQSSHNGGKYPPFGKKREHRLEFKDWWQTDKEGKGKNQERESIREKKKKREKEMRRDVRGKKRIRRSVA